MRCTGPGIDSRFKNCAFSMVRQKMYLTRSILKKLTARVNVTKATEIVKHALGIYDWATSEIEIGRTVVSASISGEDVRRLVSPEFSNIKTVVKKAGAS